MINIEYSKIFFEVWDGGKGGLISDGFFDLVPSSKKCEIKKSGTTLFLQSQNPRLNWSFVIIGTKMEMLSEI